MGVGHSSSFGRCSNLNEAATTSTASKPNSRSPCYHQGLVSRNSIETLQKYLFFDDELSPSTILDTRNLPVVDDADELESSTTTETSPNVDSPEFYHFAPCRMFPKNNDEDRNRIEKSAVSSSRIPVADKFSKNSVSARIIDQTNDVYVDGDEDLEHLKRMYDRRTWNMYVRIMEARERSKTRIPTQVITYGSAIGSNSTPHCYQDISTLQDSTIIQETKHIDQEWIYHSTCPIEGESHPRDGAEGAHQEHDLIFGGFE
jgi:hypothetical protein